MSRRQALKNLVAQSPLAMEAYWQLRKHTYRARFKMFRLREALPNGIAQARPHLGGNVPGKRVLVVAAMHYWIEYSALLSVVLRGMGYRPTLVYMPFADYIKPLSLFEIKRQSLHARDMLKPAEALFPVVNLLDVQAQVPLASAIEHLIAEISFYDTQYALEREDVTIDSDLYRLRLERNTVAARAALTLLNQNRPDVVVVPNGTVLEFAVFYRVAKQLGIPVVTYEFSEDREQIWLALDDEVMRQNTRALWQACQDIPLTDTQRARIEQLESARVRARAFGKSDRLWQDVPAEGGSQVRAALNLDARPVALLATNVIGDSLTLGRNIFSQNMGEWIVRTIAYFAEHPTAQLVIRVHPGERYSKGPSMVAVIAAAFPQLPENVRVVGPQEKINTYDVMEIADLALCFTTTVGLEAAMSGLPVIVVGDTHYRGRGFTHDPVNWDEYHAVLQCVLADPFTARLPAPQVEAAWNYAYRFFFQYPRPFPWRLYDFWKDIEVWPVARVLSGEGQAAFGQTFKYLTGDPIEWNQL